METDAVPLENTKFPNQDFFKHKSNQFSSVQSPSHVRLFATLWTAAHQASMSFTISLSLLKLLLNESVMHSTISYSVIPFSCLQSFLALGPFLMSHLFTLGGQSIGASALVLKINNQNSFPLGLTGSFSLNPRDSLKSLLQPHSSSINSSVLSFLYSPTLTSIHNYWKNHSFD